MRLTNYTKARVPNIKTKVKIVKFRHKKYFRKLDKTYSFSRKKVENFFDQSEPMPRHEL